MVVISTLPQLAELERTWRSLMSAAPHSFFLSWPWIRTWLCCLPGHISPYLLSITRPETGAIVALGLLVRTTLRRRGVLPIRTWVLNATGDPDLDQIFIEQNGLLADTDSVDLAWSSWANAFTEAHGDWDEIQLRGVPPKVLTAWAHPSLQLEEDVRMIDRYVDLDVVRSAGVPFVNTMTKKRRARIRHTVAALERIGKIELEVASCEADAFEFFAQLKALHQERWSARRERGAFGYPFFERFHSELIRTHFADGVIQLIRVRVKDVIVGVLYNFVHGDTVTVYQTGFNYAVIREANKESPGLLTHVLAIDYNAQRGYRRYDLLAGDSEYKRALANECETLWWGRVQRKRLKFHAEALLRRMWRKVAGRISARASGGECIGSCGS